MKVKVSEALDSLQKNVEFFYKKKYYAFPQQTKIFADGNRVFAEISGKAVSNISKYLSKPEGASDIGFAITSQSAQTYKKYEGVAEYFAKNPDLDMISFDYATAGELSLCTFFKSDDIRKTQLMIGEIKKSLPYLTNIFLRPVTQLTEIDAVLPVDSVKRVTGDTYRHFLSNARNWKSVQNGKAVPKKLLTKLYDDDYGIYENVVFKELIDRILWFLLKRTYRLSDALYALNESVRIDPLARVNHGMYYLAIGKLYIGFSQTENSGEIAALLEEAKKLYGYIEPYKACAVYAKNAAKKADGYELRQTNLFTMHRDYMHVYRLFEMFGEGVVDKFAPGGYDNQQKSQRCYEQFCGALTLFALKNFSLTCNPKDAVYSGGKFGASFWFKEWKIALSSGRSEALDINTFRLEVSFDQNSVSALLIPFCRQWPDNAVRQYERLVKRLSDSGEHCDKYVFLDPFEATARSAHDYNLKVAGEPLYYAVLPVSISEFNSFRRLQKILFECMVKSGVNFSTCAFCGEALTKERENKYLCAKCRTSVEKTVCGRCGEAFVGTFADIKSSGKEKQKDPPGRDKPGDPYLKLPKIFKDEKKYLFRNITDLKDGSYVCPHCGKARG
ncbi:MAG: hypothetical protein FWD58_04460 [Firmicutes bacterium]|nr:hypothetical protein [Bacillota bacterium]